jgi:hypothetical protein
MLARIFRSLVALATIIVVYQCYVLLAVPLLEPPQTARAVSPVTEKEYAAAAQSVTRYQRLLANYFPAEHWSQKKPPMVLMNGPALLVLDRYERFEDGRVDIPQFALLIFPTPLEEGGAAPRDAIILEAPEGARLQFDDHFHLERGQVGQIVGGSFPGPIIIRSDMHEAGPADDLLIETSEIVMTSKLLYTNKPVRLRMGQNVGSGRELEIRLLEGPDARSNKLGVASLEILRDVRLRVDLKTGSLLPSELSGSHAEPATADLRRGNENARRGNELSAPAPPVDVTCTGPFHFDFVRYVASFDQNVKIRQLNSGGPGDALDAAQLDIHFAPKPMPVGAPPLAIETNRRQQTELSRLEPSLVVAQGEPVVITSPRLEAEARSRRIQLHLLDRRVTLDGGPDTVLVYGASVLKAPIIDYWHPAEDSATKIGRFRASGPGSLFHVRDRQRSDEVFQANWQSSVELGRSNGQPVFVLTGRPQVGMKGVGTLAADQLTLTFRELQGTTTDGTRGKLQLIPDRLAATSGVEITSPKLTARTEQLLAVFTSPTVQPEAPVTAANGDNTGAQAAASVAPAAPARSLAAQLSPSARAERPTSAYHIETDELQLGVTLSGRDATPSTIACEGNVVFREIPLVPTGKQPLELRGHQLTAGGLDMDAARIKIVGTAAAASDTAVYSAPGNGPYPGWVKLTGRGMTFHTAAVEIDQRENRLWSDGPGVATLLVTRDLEGRAAETPHPIEIRWRDGLNFDGKSAVFRGNIQGQGPDDALRCDLLIARLAAPIDFDAPKPGGDQAVADIAEIEFQGQPVIINHRSHDRNGPASHDRVQLAQLTINQQTGDVRGRGPGVIRSTRYGNALNGLGGLAAIGGQRPADPTTPPEPESKLIFLRTDFDGPLKGNLFTRMFEISDRVRTVLGPVDSWEQELDGSRPETLPPRSLTIECEVLRANEDPMSRLSPQPPGDPSQKHFGFVQLHAERDVRIDARSANLARLNAQADVATFDQGKQTILIKGEGRAATLRIQNRPGEPANPIHSNVTYSLGTKLPEFHGFQGAEFTMPSDPRTPIGPAAARGSAGPPR